MATATKTSFKKSIRAASSLQCRRFLWARNLLAKAPCWNFPKRGGDGASQRERGGGGEREEKTPARKHCENEKHLLIGRAWPLFRKWVVDNNKTTKQSLQSKDSHCLKKNKLNQRWRLQQCYEHEQGFAHPKYTCTAGYPASNLIALIACSAGVFWVGEILFVFVILL